MFIGMIANGLAEIRREYVRGRNQAEARHIVEQTRYALTLSFRDPVGGRKLLDQLDVRAKKLPEDANPFRQTTYKPSPCPKAQEPRMRREEESSSSTGGDSWMSDPYGGFSAPTTLLMCDSDSPFNPGGGSFGGAGVSGSY